MNAIIHFNLCTLSNQELAQKVDALTDELFDTQKIPFRHIPARPNEDYDLLVGEMVKRFIEASDNILGNCAKCNKVLFNMDEHKEIPENNGVSCVLCS
jgi:hypothetical protein